MCTQTAVAIDLEAALRTWASIQRNELDHTFPEHTQADYEAAEVVSRGIVKLENLARIEMVQTLITFYGAYPEARHESKDERCKVLEDMYGAKRWPGLLKKAKQFLTGFMEAQNLSCSKMDRCPKPSKAECLGQGSVNTAPRYAQLP